MFFHAHPDDEALLTSGTMARLAAEGHRVVLVVATDGEAGLADPEGLAGRALGAVRREETLASAHLLGCERVEFLGYGDSGLQPGRAAVPGTFRAADAEHAAHRLAALLEEERADLLTIYDPVGGYGHPDHVQVHHVGSRAAQLAATPVVLEATVDRDLLLRALRWVARIPFLGVRVDPGGFRDKYVPGESITHRVDVRRWAALKRESMAAHASQAGGGDGVRTLAALRRLPLPLFRRALGTEWFVQRGLPAGHRSDHPLSARLMAESAGMLHPSPK
ncbi:PIG-L deacetylase family protein [Streptomyces sp. NPDC002533]